MCEMWGGSKCACSQVRHVNSHTLSVSLTHFDPISRLPSPDINDDTCYLIDGIENHMPTSIAHIRGRRPTSDQRKRTFGDCRGVVRHNSRLPENPSKR